ncbi:unnamed protein product [Linum tenue]|uniref:Aminotransferase class I/classII large domain-containing protein n=1 Tax=Linum tenue TaxID=586396 RepID=A0AAV0ME88_9ROSI|nr:unnamed protein product [Linum tenue]
MRVEDVELWAGLGPDPTHDRVHAVGQGVCGGVSRGEPGQASGGTGRSRAGWVGIRCLRSSNAGLFVLMDLRRLLKEKIVEEEMALWRVIINEVKLNVSSGSSFYCL